MQEYRAFPGDSEYFKCRLRRRLRQEENPTIRVRDRVRYATYENIKTCATVLLSRTAVGCSGRNLDPYETGSPSTKIRINFAPDSYM